MDATGNVYVSEKTDRDHFRIQQFTNSGSPISRNFHTGHGNRHSIAAHENVYTAKSLNPVERTSFVRFPLNILNFPGCGREKTLPDQLRIGTDAPNEKVPLARFDFQKNWTARVIRKNLKMPSVIIDLGFSKYRCDNLFLQCLIF